MKILNDGSVEGQTFSGDKYEGDYPIPEEGETYSEYHMRVEILVKEGFHLGDLSWTDWETYCKGFPGNDSHMQNEVID